ncbi:phosphate signaling complex protein PhoU [Arcanobacterium haemolyticum]|nr:phosphate signaling complex protein PhoU [Arcanobacterium haemolyticum]
MHDLTKTLTLEAQAAAKAMKRAAAALKNANLAVAEQVIDSDSRIDLLERHIDDMGISMLARQAPVASDLRTVVSALRLSSILERMGDLARHVAYVARGRYPQTPVEGDVFAILSRMADQAEIVGKKVAELIETHDLRLADAIIDDDDVLDDLHREIFSIVLDPGHDLSRQEIVDAVLLSRYLERYGDHAVSVANRMRFLVTGLEPN